MFYENFVKLTKEKYQICSAGKEHLEVNNTCVGGALIKFLEPRYVRKFPSQLFLRDVIEKHFLGITFDAANRYAHQIIFLSDEKRFDEAFNVVEQLSKEFPVTI